MKHILTLSAVALLFVAISSCSKTEPAACFTVVGGIDSVYVGELTAFDGSCSKDATQYKWKFSDQPDSVYYAQQYVRSFDSIDTLTVSLTAILGGRENVLEQTLIVKTP